MALTPEQKKDSYQFFIIAFGAPTGVEYMNQLNDAYGAGMTTKEIVNVYTTKPEFEAQYPRFESNEQFAIKLIENVVGASATAEAKAEAVADVVGSLNAGWTKGDVVFQIFTNLAGKDKADPQWGATAQMLDNKVAVAEHITETLGVNTTDLAQLSALIANVTADVATVEVAKTGAAGANGETFMLTAGADNIAGTSGNDTVTALTINAAGAAATTLSAFDSIDGGAGTDTLNIYNDNTNNTSLPASASIKNVENINIYNDGGAFHTGTAGTIDASKFVGVTNLLQATRAADVTNLAAATTATFKGQNTTAAADLSVTAASGVASANVALDGVKGTDAGTPGTFDAGDNTAHLTVAGDALASVTVSGSLAQAVVSTAAAAAANLTLNVTAGKDVETLTVNTAVKSTLAITEGAGTAAAKEIKVVDASASAGGVTYVGTVTGGANVRTIKTGAGADTVTIATATTKDDATTAADETVSALLETGAGNDTITINTTDAAASAAGKTTVNAGEGNDTVTLTSDGTGVLTVNLGAGDDTFKGAGSVAATDVIDGGDGTDTLLLNMVGAANIGAFSNFETFDAAGLAKTLDVEILAAKNTVTEFVSTGTVGKDNTDTPDGDTTDAIGAAGVQTIADVNSATLTNLGAGVNFRATGAMGTATLNLTQKTAAALTVTLDADSTSTTAQNDANAIVTATNATSLKAVFASDSGYNDPTVNTNDQTITLTGTKATALEVVSGGTNATNVIKFATDDVSATDAKSTLKTITISGDQLLKFEAADLTLSSSTNDIEINASAMTGGLVTTLDNVKATGTLSLGSGDDVITVQTGVAVDVATIIGAHRKVVGVEKGSAEDLTAISNYDVFKLTGAIQAVDNTTGNADASVKDGKVTFKGAGPATLDKAVEFAQALISANEAAVFEYVGKSFIFAEGATNGAGDDVLIELTGVTGLNGLDVVNSAAGTLYVF